MRIASFAELDLCECKTVYVVRQHARLRAGQLIWTQHCTISEWIVRRNDAALSDCFGPENEIGMTAVFTTRQSAEDHQVMIALYADYDDGQFNERPTRFLASLWSGNIEARA